MGSNQIAPIIIILVALVVKCGQVSGNLRNWSHLLKKSIMENFIFCTALYSLLQSFMPIFCVDFLSFQAAL